MSSFEDDIEVKAEGKKKVVTYELITKENNPLDIKDRMSKPTEATHNQVISVMGKTYQSEEVIHPFVEFINKFMKKVISGQKVTNDDPYFGAMYHEKVTYERSKSMPANLQHILLPKFPDKAGLLWTDRTVDHASSVVAIPVSNEMPSYDRVHGWSTQYFVSRLFTVSNDRCEQYGIPNMSKRACMVTTVYSDGENSIDASCLIFFARKTTTSFSNNVGRSMKQTFGIMEPPQTAVPTSMQNTFKVKKPGDNYFDPNDEDIPVSRKRPTDEAIDSDDERQRSPSPPKKKAALPPSDSEDEVKPVPLKRKPSRKLVEVSSRKSRKILPDRVDRDAETEDEEDSDDDGFVVDDEEAEREDVGDEEPSDGIDITDEDVYLKRASSRDKKIDTGVAKKLEAIGDTLDDILAVFRRMSDDNSRFLLLFERFVKGRK